VCSRVRVVNSFTRPDSLERAAGQRLPDTGDVAMGERLPTSFKESVLSRKEDDNARFECGRKLDEFTFYSSSP